ncbi:uncharacterized protein BJ212DRAFT_1304457 [Suillus subaureus]|uniref:Uncharacterized protein n=1 Tax=Suillus subaureus TaxID=48587 RepID=A0A9P7DVJ1_9AGAM|nr:uncharacterized protein BJ212DRAFT_1304457 [Suillus subaureus]KAG1804056.1 hypothetical protein BJ212DRAFT_1304457 [Suillus subaureus]
MDEVGGASPKSHTLPQTSDFNIPWILEYSPTFPSSIQMYNMKRLDVYLCNHYFSVCFSGILPGEFLQENIPVQISVSIAEEYGMFTTPVVNTVSMDMRDPDSWQTNSLPSSDEIESWLVTKVDSESPLWAWGCDAFWLAFIGGYPCFLRGRWPMWDSRVPLQGTFIEAWLDQLSGAEGNWIGVQSAPEDDQASASYVSDMCQFYVLGLLPP